MPVTQTEVISGAQGASALDVGESHVQEDQSVQASGDLGPMEVTEGPIALDDYLLDKWGVLRLELLAFRDNPLYEVNFHEYLSNHALADVQHIINRLYFFRDQELLTSTIFNEESNLIMRRFEIEQDELLLAYGFIEEKDVDPFVLAPHLFGGDNPQVALRQLYLKAHGGLLNHAEDGAIPIGPHRGGQFYRHPPVMARFIKHCHWMAEGYETLLRGYLDTLIERRYDAWEGDVEMQDFSGWGGVNDYLNELQTPIRRAVTPMLSNFIAAELPQWMHLADMDLMQITDDANSEVYREDALQDMHSMVEYVEGGDFENAYESMAHSAYVYSLGCLNLITAFDSELQDFMQRFLLNPQAPVPEYSKG